MQARLVLVFLVCASTLLSASPAVARAQSAPSPTATPVAAGGTSGQPAPVGEARGVVGASDGADAVVARRQIALGAFYTDGIGSPENAGGLSLAYMYDGPDWAFGGQTDFGGISGPPSATTLTKSNHYVTAGGLVRRYIPVFGHTFVPFVGLGVSGMLRFSKSEYCVKGGPPPCVDSETSGGVDSHVITSLEAGLAMFRTSSVRLTMSLRAEAAPDYLKGPLVVPFGVRGALQF